MTGWRVRGAGWLAAIGLVMGAAAAAQTIPPASRAVPVPDGAAGVAAVPGAAPEPHVQSAVEALAQDGGEYARHYGVSLAEAMHRLREQEESVAATDRVRTDYRDRLAGISIEHAPAYRIVVLLTGDAPVEDERIGVDRPLTISFRTGAVATAAQVAAAIATHQAEMRAALPQAGGMGLDGRTGMLVVMMTAAAAAGRDIAADEARLAAIAGVPVRIRPIGEADTDLSIDGGSRIVGTDPANGRRFACTTGFVVRDGAGSGIATAAHCPDEVTYFAPGGARTPLAFVGQWGARYQDVQIHRGEGMLRPLFYADTARTVARAVNGWRNRASTRTGDFVCHRGERSGYSCAEVILTDYAPPPPLCAGPCDPVWVAVAGPSCRSGDSGGPVFSRGIAFGILKGASYARGGACDFYFYMSTDYLPAGWSLAYERGGGG